MKSEQTKLLFYSASHFTVPEGFVVDVTSFTASFTWNKGVLNCNPSTITITITEAEIESSNGISKTCELVNPQSNVSFTCRMSNLLANTFYSATAVACSNDKCGCSVATAPEVFQTAPGGMFLPFIRK